MSKEEEGTYAGTMMHYGPSLVSIQPFEIEPKRMSTEQITVAPIDTARETNRMHRRVFEQAAHDEKPRIQTLADINRAQRAQWRQP